MPDADLAFAPIPALGARLRSGIEEAHQIGGEVGGAGVELRQISGAGLRLELERPVEQRAQLLPALALHAGASARSVSRR